MRMVTFARAGAPVPSMSVAWAMARLPCCARTGRACAIVVIATSNAGALDRGACHGRFSAV